MYRRRSSRLGEGGNRICRCSPDWPICILAAASLLASLAATIVVGRSTTYSAPSVRIVQKSTAYYVLHGTDILCVSAAGVLAWLQYSRRTVPRYFRLTLVVFIGVGIIMGVRGLSLGGILSLRVFGSTGPFICGISLLALAGARASNWHFFHHFFLVIGAVSVVVVATAIVSVEVAGRAGLTSIGSAAGTLFYCGAWLVLRNPGRVTASALLGWVQLGVFVVVAVLTQTRLDFVMIALFLVGWGLAVRREKKSLPVAVALGMGTLVIAGFVVSAGMIFLPQAGVVRQSINGVLARAGDDTRSGQLVNFFSDVAPVELLTGRGSEATWLWNGIEWAGGTDVGYLSLLLYGGVPLLACYLLLHGYPAWHAAFAARDSEVLACAIVAGLWGTVMLSSAMPTFDAGYYIVLLCVGRCVSTIPVRSGRRSRPAVAVRVTHADPLVHQYPAACGSR